MFSIQLDLPESVSKHGIEAIDWRRRLGLPTDQNSLSFKGRARKLSHSEETDIESAECEVEEAFARCYFNSKQTNDFVSVPLELLIPGDLRISANNDDVATFNNLSPDRIKAIYTATKFHLAKKYIERLKKKIKSLESELATTRPPSSQE